MIIATADAPTEAGVELQRLRAGLSTMQAADLLWGRHFKLSQQRLGGSIEKAINNFGNVTRMWMFVHGVSFTRATIEAGEAFRLLHPDDVDWLLRESGELPRNREEAKAQAIEQGYLVILASELCVYWNNQLIEVEWDGHGEAFRFLKLACEHAKKKELITPMSFRGNVRANIVTQSISRLKSVPGFPSELIKHFDVNREETGTQWFDFPSEQVHIF